ncbi:alpha/beta fold hydrolase [Microbacterium sp. ET2]|uniref:alpha/beta fold hydrolase n=1 Tax=Microbacterium albipurpureum TaxID=3050384 RepID=UPI00259D0E1D|nr:alpha/beta fold hydrolase [Microbacterium sp. ET2 (Ac-2212)]WJL94436.1 alpha/beta fold hydrolase [Microbacterium sp. ET2 (Ac-2212)]
MTRPVLTLTDAGGPAGAPLVVLGNSLGTSTILWEQVVPALRDRFRVRAFDLPGHGVSPAATDAFSVADLADALAEEIAEPFHYVGVSLGGAVGLELALRHPSLVRSATVIASGARIGTAEGWQERAAQVRQQSTSSLIIASAGRWFAPDTIAEKPDLTGRLLHSLRDADAESYARCCEALAAHDVRDRLGEITVPVLAVWGGHDQVTPESFAREIADGVARGRATGIPTAAHLPPADDPTATAAVVAEFISEIERTSDDPA